MDDYYKVLGIEKTANQQEIKKAFRTQAFKFHPDQHPNDPHAEAQFKKINEAYSVLGDETKRASYDANGYYSDNGFSANSQTAQGGFNPFEQAYRNSNSNPFGNFWENSQGQRRTQNSEYYNPFGNATFYTYRRPHKKKHTYSEILLDLLLSLVKICFGIGTFIMFRRTYILLVMFMAIMLVTTGVSSFISSTKLLFAKLRKNH